jgi:hypothetical protein
MEKIVKLVQLDKKNGRKNCQKVVKKLSKNCPKIDKKFVKILKRSEEEDDCD